MLITIHFNQKGFELARGYWIDQMS